MPSVRMANTAASYRLLEAGQYRGFPCGQGHRGLILGSFPPSRAVTAGIIDGLSWRAPPCFLVEEGIILRLCSGRAERWMGTRG